jgi:hypothetical protein
MKYILLLLISFAINKENPTIDLTVETTGFSSSHGSLSIALFREKDEFPVFGKQFKGKIVAIDGKTTKVFFNDLPTGKYAIAAYHDKNNNKKLDKNQLGIPQENYGFSNNARRMFSAPSFEEASFELKSKKTIQIFLK